MSKIKVLHTEWSDGWGGQEIRIINEMLAIKKHDIEVFLACKKSATIKQKALENGIEVFTLPFRGNVDLKTIFSLVKIVKKYNINIINTHSGKDTWVGGIAAKLAGIKFIRTRHLSNRIRTSRLNFINELADFIFTTGEKVRENMINENRIDPEKIISIPTGIDKNIFDSQKYDKQACKKKFKMDTNSIIIGNVGVLRSSKRQDNFLQIARDLIDKYPDKSFRFYIAGEGPTRESLEKNIKDLRLQNHATLLGHIENIAEFLKTLDIFLFTSDIGEGVPQSVMQALFMELNVISTDDGSTSDLYHDNNFLLCSTKIEDLYKNSCKMVENLENLDFLNKDRAFMIENFSSQASNEKILKCYEKILK